MLPDNHQGQVTLNKTICLVIMHNNIRMQHRFLLLMGGLGIAVVLLVCIFTPRSGDRIRHAEIIEPPPFMQCNEGDPLPLPLRSHKQLLHGLWVILVINDTSKGMNTAITVRNSFRHNISSTNARLAIVCSGRNFDIISNENDSGCFTVDVGKDFINNEPVNQMVVISKDGVIKASTALLCDAPGDFLTDTLLNSINESGKNATPQIDSGIDWRVETISQPKECPIGGKAACIFKLLATRRIDPTEHPIRLKVSKKSSPLVSHEFTAQENHQYVLRFEYPVNHTETNAASITIQTEDGTGEYIVRSSVNGVGRISINPQFLDFGIVRKGSSHELQMYIRCTEQKLQPRISYAGTVVSLEKISSTDDFSKYTFSLNTKLECGIFNEQVPVISAVNNISCGAVIVHAVVCEDYYIEPMLLDFGCQAPKSRIGFRLKISRVDNSPVRSDIDSIASTSSTDITFTNDKGPEIVGHFTFPPRNEITEGAIRVLVNRKIEINVPFMAVTIQ